MVSIFFQCVCDDSSSDFDYEEVGERRNSDTNSSRPSAMELVAPVRNSITVNRTLWCEIPEVINSSVLSTLNTHQMKLQEAKFEMITSEASYLNSLNVLVDHFIASIETCEQLTQEEKDKLFGKIMPGTAFLLKIARITLPNNLSLGLQLKNVPKNCYTTSSAAGRITFS